MCTDGISDVIGTAVHVNQKHRGAFAMPSYMQDGDGRGVAVSMTGNGGTVPPEVIERRKVVTFPSGFPVPVFPDGAPDGCAIPGTLHVERLFSLGAAWVPTAGIPVILGEE